MAASPYSHADLRTGACIVIGVAALIGVVLGLPHLLEPEHRVVSVRFPFSAGVQGITTGTPLYMGGLEIGRVQSISLAEGDRGDHPMISATLTILRDVKVPRTATISIQRSITGTETTLNVSLPPGDQGPHAQAGDTLGVSVAKTPLETIFGTTRAAEAERAIATLQATPFFAEVRDFGERSATLLTQSQDATKTIREDWPAWELQAKALIAARDDAHARFEALRGLFAEGQPLDAARLEATIARTEDNFAVAAELLATVKLRVTDQVVPPVADLIDRLQRVVATTKADSARIELLLAQSKDAVRSASADLSIAGDQIGRTTREVTLMPWTLLGGVFEDRSEEARFRTFAREIVRSAADLHIAVETARSLLANDPDLAKRHPEVVELLTRWIDQASAEHEAAGTILLNQLIGVPAQ